MKDLEKNLSALSKILHEIRVEEVMTKPVSVINLNEDFSVAEEAFVKKRLRHLPVVNGKREIVGLISQRDVYRHIAPRRALDGKIIYRKNIIVDGDGYYERDSLDQYILNHIMHKNPKTLGKGKSLGDAINVMVKNKVGCVPITNKKKHVIGIITRYDILKLANMVFKKN